MKKLALALALASLVGVTHAEVVGTAGVESNFVFRGVSQSANAPSVVAGATYELGGFYLGTTEHSVSGVQSGAGIRSDVVAGYGVQLGQVSVDVGSQNYFGARQGLLNTNTNEVFVAAKYRIASVKYSRSIGNEFGLANSNGSSYLQTDLTYYIPQTAFALTGHAGRQIDRMNSEFNHNDYSLGTQYKVGRWNLTAQVVADSNKSAQFSNAALVNGQNLAKRQVVLGVTTQF